MSNPRLVLSNPLCQVEVSPERGGRITSFRSQASGYDHVGPDHLQTWVKTGRLRDPTVGVLHLFHADLHTRTFDMEANAPPGCAYLQAVADGILFRKRFRLDRTQPVLTMEVEAVNQGAAPRVVQFESFFNWNFGPTVDGSNVVTVIRRGGKDLRFDVAPYGTMGGIAVNVEGGSMDLCNVGRNETMRILPDDAWARFSIYEMSGSNWRGPYSVERSLAPGATFRATLQLALVQGCEALAAAEPHVVAPGPDAERAAAPRAARAVEPSFPVRILHLACGQRLDDLKWLLAEVIAPCGYTHVILELATSVRFGSHPELAAEGAISPDQIRALARFVRSLGMGAIPAMNFYGHQQATNITRAHPELQEVPGDPGVYCPTHPLTRRIVADIVREVIDIVEPRQFHIGHDEIQLHGSPPRVGVCPRCRERKPHEVFAYDVIEIHEILKAAGVRTWIWGDMLLGPDFLAGSEGNGNGIEGEVYRAIDLLPREIVIADWHYYTCEDYRSSADFMKRGFEVCPSVWWSKEGIRAYADYARSIGARAMMMTTWANPDLASLPVEPVLYAARLFQDVTAAADPDLDGQVAREAHDFWRKWQASRGRPR